MSNSVMVKKIFPLIILMRIHQPIGFFLLLWPTLWGLWLSNRGVPESITLIIFVCGAFLMRAAGCIINDYIDQNIDRYIERTKSRPLSSGMVNSKEALIMFCILIVVLLMLVCIFFNFTTILLSVIAFILSCIYPYLKRYIYYPQLILGILFSWPILMASTAINHVISENIWLLFITNSLWVIIYDTQYAMVDREADLYIGVKSLALFLNKKDKYVIGFLQLIVVLLLGIIGWKEQLSMIFYYFSMFGSTSLFVWQQFLIRNRVHKECFRAFLSNNYVGMLIFIGIALHFCNIN